MEAAPAPKPKEASQVLVVLVFRQSFNMLELSLYFQVVAQILVVSMSNLATTFVFCTTKNPMIWKAEPFADIRVEHGATKAWGVSESSSTSAKVCFVKASWLWIIFIDKDATCANLDLRVSLATWKSGKKKYGIIFSRILL